jgi:hypothetical protein
LEEATPVPEGQGLYSVARAGAVPEGGYTLVVAVEAGAPSLAGVRAKVFGRYEVCEMEVLPGMLWGLGACLVGVAAGLLWLAVGARFLRVWVRANRHPQPAG